MPELTVDQLKAIIATITQEHAAELAQARLTIAELRVRLADTQTTEAPAAQPPGEE